METELVKSLLRNQNDSQKNCLENSNFFDSAILSYKSQALALWRNTTERYKTKEQKYSIPFSLAEKPKLYSIDALVVAKPLIKNGKHLGLAAEFWNVFFLMVHYFDDHVEHLDKFYSKFHFSVDNDLNTQKGAAPFSFVFISLEILQDILVELEMINIKDREHIIRSVMAELANQTKYFAPERKRHISFDEVFKIKQLGVSGETFGVFAELLRCIPSTRNIDYTKLKRGFMSLGSLIQITDDIRDIAIDMELNNANLIIAAREDTGLNAPDRIAQLYSIESETLSLTLEKIYTKRELNIIKTLPFYLFSLSKLKETC